MTRISDEPYHIQEDETCSMCGEFLLGDDRPLTMVESGRMDPMKKDPSFLKFTPDSLTDDAEDALIEVYHAECIIESAIEGDWGRFSPLQCDSCSKRFLREIPKWAFRFRIGGVDPVGLFVIDKNPANSAILCTECFEDQLRIAEGWAV